MALLKETAHGYYSGNDLGSYQFISLDHIINNFMIAYVGEGKIIPKIKRTDIAFHAQRAIQELSYDTFKSTKSQEIEIPPSLTMILPQDYVNYVKLVWSDSAGIEHIIYPTGKTSNPNKVAQDSDGNYIFENNLNVKSLIQFPVDLVIQEIIDGQTSFNHTLHEAGYDNTVATGTISQQYVPDPNPIEVGMVISSIYFPVGTTITEVISPATSGNGWFTFTTSNPANTGVVTLTDHAIQISGGSDTWNSYKSSTPSENQDDYQDNSYWSNMGDRRGLDPVHAQGNGSFYIDEIGGKIHFSSNISGKTVILKYISDGLGTDSEAIVHKFAEEAMYKSIAYAVLSTTISGQPLAPSFQQQKSVAIRTAKLRLSNLKIEELTQIMRGKSKFIKH
tara:strand:- start:1655 stop:2827 length:1173 start_codon:yes stop_codon:yes gene_type:complete